MINLPIGRHPYEGDSRYVIVWRCFVEGETPGNLSVAIAFYAALETPLDVLERMEEDARRVFMMKHPDAFDILTNWAKVFCPGEEEGL